MYKLFLTLRYLRKRRIAYFAIAAVILCTFMVLVVTSVMGGFLDKLMANARGLLGDVVVDNYAYGGFPLYQEFIDDVKQWPEIVEATPVIYTFGLLRFPQTENTALVRLVGIRLREVERVNAFGEGLFYDRHYPGSTSLAEQQQPFVGFDQESEPIPVKNEDGEVIGEYPPLSLPADLQQAYGRFRAAYEKEHGRPFLQDDETAETEMNRLLRVNHFPSIPGVYAFNIETAEPGYKGNSYPGLIIGRDIVAKRLKDGTYMRYEQYPRGCEILVSFLTREFDPTPVKQPFRYADDSRTGIYDIDSQHVYCDFNLLQTLVLMDAAERADGSGTAPARCSQIQVKLAPGADADAVAARLQEHYHTFAQDLERPLDPEERALLRRIEAVTWQRSQAHIIEPVKKERLLVTTLFGIISLVAMVLVLCILYMIVLQKTRDIGIIKSIGGSARGVALIFIFYGVSIGVVGSVIGATGGFFFVKHINEFQELLIRLNPQWQVWDRSVYAFDEIPNTVRGWDVFNVILFMIVTSTVGALAAAWRAARMNPVESLRYE